jgi:hypothetical protein
MLYARSRYIWDWFYVIFIKCKDGFDDSIDRD